MLFSLFRNQTLLASGVVPAQNHGKYSEKFDIEDCFSKWALFFFSPSRPLTLKASKIFEILFYYEFDDQFSWSGYEYYLNDGRKCISRASPTYKTAKFKVTYVTSVILK